MIFRALFWIGLVAVMMPHEPDLGFGRPASADVAATAGSGIADWARTKLQTNGPRNLCRDNTDACSAGVSMIETFRAATMRSLADVKADLRENGHGRSN